MWFIELVVISGSKTSAEGQTVKEDYEDSEQNKVRPCQLTLLLTAAIFNS